MKKNNNNLTVFAFVAFLFVAAVFVIWANFFSANIVISNPASLVKFMEQKSSLEIMRFNIQHVIDDTNKKDFLGIDFLALDDKVLISFDASVTACIDLRQISTNDVFMSEDKVELSLPRPILCDKVNIDQSSIVDHIKSGFDVEKFRKESMTKTASERCKNFCLINIWTLILSLLLKLL